ncbi:FAD/NAD(P)-binding protein [Ornithinimicrobium cavernae]|uniref:FAD/NAD(P)-binding protein n=1 Tax=Ornithinimicrobium cavernae TaxID=2666047 RepID=UPI000D68F821|nr:FAD/NAD(P)-binding protein [Ornithinimicrobium cavernae]
MADTPLRIAVVGAGPRGASVVERLIANHELAGPRPVQILLMDPHPFGSGRIWSGDQPHHLLMNTLCADATHFTDDTVACEGRLVTGPTLYEWATTVVAAEPAGHEPEIVDEAGRLQPWSHPSRKLLGRYLEWCHAQDLTRLPDSMSLTPVPEEVIAVRPLDTEAEGLEEDAGSYRVSTTGGSWLVDAVVLATGHSDLRAGPRQAQLEEHARRHGLFHGPPANPIDQDLDGVAAGEKLAVRGLGMNFFDYMSLLTTGRGGRFTETGDGGLVYEPSGREPVMVAGSRRGVPYRAKGAFGTMTPTFERRYLTDEHLELLAGAGRQLDFMTDLWPYVAKDTLWTYYSVLAATRPEALTVELDELVSHLDDHEWGDPGLTRALADMVPEEADRLDLEQLDRPLRGRTFADQAELTAWWRADLAHDYAQSQLGYGSALKCASVALGAGRAPIRNLARYGGFTGTSYSRHIEGWFRGFGGALASGPPARRILELGALVDAGLVIPAGPDMRVEAREDHFVVTSPAVAGTEHRCQGLLEAHLPPADAAHSGNPLIRQLVDEGHARPYVIPDPGAPDFVSGALEVGPQPYALVNSEGQEQAGLYAIGVPLESIHWGTQLGPLARTNSRFLRDTDAVARAALTHGKARHDLARTPVGQAARHHA